jgi:hypothetical protein
MHRLAQQAFHVFFESDRRAHRSIILGSGSAVKMCVAPAGNLPTPTVASHAVV